MIKRELNQQRRGRRLIGANRIISQAIGVHSDSTPSILYDGSRYSVVLTNRHLDACPHEAADAHHREL
jgi:hypothetical protein